MPGHKFRNPTPERHNYGNGPENVQRTLRDAERRQLRSERSGAALLADSFIRQWNT